MRFQQKEEVQKEVASLLKNLIIRSCQFSKDVVSVGKNNQIDFSYFLGQKLVDINTNEDTFLILILANGELSVECPWRLRNKRVILIGETDCVEAPERYSRDKLKQILVNKKIKNVIFSKELFLLSIEFDGNLFFDLFHNSNYFEGWVLRGDEVDEIFSVPGGDVPN